MNGTENVGSVEETLNIMPTTREQIAPVLNAKNDEKKISSAEENLEGNKRIIKMTFFLKIIIRPDFFKIIDVATPEEKLELSNLEDVDFKEIDSSNDTEKYVVRATLYQKRLEEKKETTYSFDPGVFKFTATLFIASVVEKKKTGKKKWDWKKRGSGKKMGSGKHKSRLICLKEVGTEDEIRAIATVIKKNCGTTDEYQVCKAFLRGEFLRSLEHSQLVVIPTVYNS